MLILNIYNHRNISLQLKLITFTLTSEIFYKNTLVSLLNNFTVFTTIFINILNQHADIHLKSFWGKYSSIMCTGASSEVFSIKSVKERT